MGLTIKNYDYSYAMIHRLRQGALDVEGTNIPIMKFYYTNIKTKYEEFVNHSDCQGGYISKTSKQYESYKKKWDIAELMFGDLDELKREVIELNKEIKPFLKEDLVIIAWINFYDDVMSARKILKFH